MKTDSEFDAISILIEGWSTAWLESLHAHLDLVLEERYRNDREKAITDALEILTLNELTLEDLAEAKSRTEVEKIPLKKAG